MDWPELIKAAPDLLLLVIPGFLSIKISEQNRCKRKYDHFDLVLYSILYSFLIGVIYSFILGVIFEKNGRGYLALSGTIGKNIAYIILAIILGVILVKMPSWRIGEKIQDFFNPDISQESSVWIEAMKHSPHGAWATVYLNNGLCYTGKLINYTVEFEESPKEILLTNYRLTVYHSSKDGPCKAESDEGDFYEEIVDYTEDATAQVYLTMESVCAVEIKISEEEANTIEARRKTKK